MALRRRIATVGMPSGRSRDVAIGGVLGLVGGVVLCSVLGLSRADRLAAELARVESEYDAERASILDALVSAREAGDRITDQLDGLLNGEPGK